MWSALTTVAVITWTKLHQLLCLWQLCKTVGEKPVFYRSVNIVFSLKVYVIEYLFFNHEDRVDISNQRLCTVMLEEKYPSLHTWHIYNSPVLTKLLLRHKVNFETDLTCLFWGQLQVNHNKSCISWIGSKTLFIQVSGQLKKICCKRPKLQAVYWVLLELK